MEGFRVGVHCRRESEMQGGSEEKKQRGVWTRVRRREGVKKTTEREGGKAGREGMREPEETAQGMQGQREGRGT